ncbi:uncharacterized protein [Anabrus simplex]|uniref:uncharacterized protein n=1 Tax=Anabrus simplex TaxID=316456 RepID=UPI0034DD23F5
MLTLRLWVFLSIYAMIHSYDKYLTDTCDPNYVLKLIRESCNADRRRSIAIARAGPFLAALMPMALPGGSISSFLEVPANWTVEEDAMQDESYVEVRQSDEKFRKLHEYCCQNHCDHKTFIGTC